MFGQKNTTSKTWLRLGIITVLDKRNMLTLGKRRDTSIDSNFKVQQLSLFKVMEHMANVDIFLVRTVSTVHSVKQSVSLCT